MYNQQYPASRCHFPEVSEILEHILLSLNAEDITRATVVSRFWQACIGGSRPLMRKCYKLPIHVEEGDNPHFTEITEASRNAVIPRFIHEGQNLWNVVRSIENEQLTTLHEVPEKYLETDEYDKGIKNLSKPLLGRDVQHSLWIHGRCVYRTVGPSACGSFIAICATPGTQISGSRTCTRSSGSSET